MYCCLLSSECFERRMDPVDLASLWLCEKPDCVYAVTNGLVDVKDLLPAMSSHIAEGLVNLQPKL